MPRKYLRQELEIRAGEKEIYVYNKHGDLIRTHKRSYTPKDWMIIPSDMPAEYKDYGYWNVPYFQQKASAIVPAPEPSLMLSFGNTLIQCRHSEAVLAFCATRKSTRQKPWNAAVKTQFWQVSAIILISAIRSLPIIRNHCRGRHPKTNARMMLQQPYPVLTKIMTVSIPLETC